MPDTPADRLRKVTRAFDPGEGVLDAIRSAISAEPALLEGLGLEQVGWGARHRLGTGRVHIIVSECCDGTDKYGDAREPSWNVPVFALSQEQEPQEGNE